MLGVLCSVCYAARCANSVLGVTVCSSVIDLGAVLDAPCRAPLPAPPQQSPSRVTEALGSAQGLGTAELPTPGSGSDTSRCMGGMAGCTSHGGSAGWHSRPTMSPQPVLEALRHHTSRSGARDCCFKARIQQRAVSAARIWWSSEPSGPVLRPEHSTQPTLPSTANGR